MQPKKGKLGEFNYYFINGIKVVFEAYSYDEIKANIKTHVNIIHLHSKIDSSAYLEYDSVCLQANKPVSVMMLHNYQEKKEAHRQKTQQDKTTLKIELYSGQVMSLAALLSPTPTLGQGVGLSPSFPHRIPQ